MDINSLIQSLTQSNLGLTAPTVDPVATNPIPATLTPSVPITNDYVKQSFQELIPYYTKLLQENGNDVSRAIGRLEEDYKTGVRYTTEDVARKTNQTVEDLKASLSQLGIDFPKEQEALQGDLNKRGIAVTQNPGGSLTYAGGGQPATELSRLNSNQSLRKEAVNRNAQRTLTDVGISGTRSLETYKQTLDRGIQDQTRSQQQYGEQTQQEIENKALSMGSMKEQNAAQAALNSQQSEAYKQLMGGGSTSGTGSSYDTRLAAWRAKGETGDLPVGWNG
jgi:hypothetical protein